MCVLPQNTSCSMLRGRPASLSTSAVVSTATLGRSPELTLQQAFVVTISLRSSAVLEKDDFPLIKASPLESQKEAFCPWT